MSSKEYHMTIHTRGGQSLIYKDLQEDVLNKLKRMQGKTPAPEVVELSRGESLRISGTDILALGYRVTAATA